RAAAALGAKESKRSVAALAKALQRDPHYAVRMAAADALGKLQTDEAFAVLAGSLDPSPLRQPSARVRQRVVMRLGDFYRPDAEAALVRVARDEPNPGVAAQAVKALGLFQTDAARAAIEAALAKPSLHERYARLAFEAAERRGDPALLPAVVAAIDRRGERYGSRTWTAALTAVARLAATGGDKTAAREAIVARLDHPKPPVRIAAIKALGELRDPTTLALVRACTGDANNRMARAAEAAAKQIEAEAAYVPEELNQLRKLVRELQADQKKLRQSVERLESKADAAAGG
ncbi:MAG: HEAT repeat domain-containing protein, partial [Planctomycetota bacterium]